MPVLTITSQKGGVGKTTLTALLAYGLARLGHKVLILDLDPQAHLSSMFLRINEIESMDSGTFHMARQDRYIIRNITVHGISGRIDIVPSGLNYLVEAYRGMFPTAYAFAIRRRIEDDRLTYKYDFIVCDTPPELFQPTLWGLYAADYVIIPTNLEELSLAGVKLLLSHVLPDVVDVVNIKVLGIAPINITRHYKPETLAELNSTLAKFIKKLEKVAKRTYEEPLFKSVIHRNHFLKDLAYTPRRWELPLSRIVESNNELRNEVEAFTKEVLYRIRNFRAISQ